MRRLQLEPFLFAHSYLKVFVHLIDQRKINHDTLVQNHKKSQRSINDTQATFFQDTASILSYVVFK